jgi:predicted acetyltransferase
MTIRRVAPGDLRTWATINENAYPAFGVASDEQKERLVERVRTQAEENPAVALYGCYQDDTLVGGMRLFDFELNMRGTMMLAGGVGAVAVDLAHKKEHVARDMIRFFVDHYRGRAAPITLLYAFRPDFYGDMGFGYGTKMSLYRIKPAALPVGGDKRRVRFANSADQEQIAACYDRFAARRHGMILKARYELNGMFRNPEQRMVAYWDGAIGGDSGDGGDHETVRGYLRFTFKRGSAESFILNDLVVTELVYETREALAGLLAFLRSQADQIDRVVLPTQDEYLHHLLRDPRNGSEGLIPSVYHESHIEGVGLMYRVSDARAVFGLLSETDFGGQTVTVKLVIHDNFVPENDGPVTVRFEQGRARVAEDDESGVGASGGGADVEVRLSVADFSSLLMGCVPFERLYAYGLAEVSDARHVETLDAIFRTRDKPMCMTAF